MRGAATAVRKRIYAVRLCRLVTYKTVAHLFAADVFRCKALLYSQGEQQERGARRRTCAKAAEPEFLFSELSA